MAEIVMESVASSNLAAVGYDPETSTLQIQFQSGATYRYSGVPETIYRGVLSGTGSFFHRHVRNQYRGEQV